MDVPEIDRACSFLPCFLTSILSISKDGVLIYLAILLTMSAGSSRPICSTDSPVGFPALSRPNSIIPPPELAKATMSFMISHHSPGEAGSNPRLNSMCFDSLVAPSAFLRISTIDKQAVPSHVYSRLRNGVDARNFEKTHQEAGERQI